MERPLRISGNGMGLNTCITLALLVVELLLPWRVGAQSNFQDINLPEVLATFESKVEPAAARAGEHVRLIITARIAEGWYTYSVVPQGEFAPPPTKLILEPGLLEPAGPLYETNPTVKNEKGATFAFPSGSIVLTQAIGLGRMVPIKSL